MKIHQNMRHSFIGSLPNDIVLKLKEVILKTYLSRKLQSDNNLCNEADNNVVIKPEVNNKTVQMKSLFIATLH
jgi:hypothetical protein